MSILLSDTVQRDDKLMAAAIDDELVILSMAGNNYLALDPIGRRIWELLEEPSRVDELCCLLSKEYNATIEEISADVVPFLSELSSEGIVNVVS